MERSPPADEGAQGGDDFLQDALARYTTILEHKVTPADGKDTRAQRMPAPLSASVRCVDPLLSAHYARPHPRPASRIPLLITTACDRWTGRPCKPFGFILPNSIHCTEALEAAEGEKERSKTGWALTQTDNLRWRAALVIVPFFSAASPKNSVPLLMVVPSTPGRTDRQSFFLVLVPIAPFQKPYLRLL